MSSSIRIPERVLAWREHLPKGSIMRPKTFRRIKGKAKRTGYRIPSAVGGKAYYVTLLSKYLDTHPKDVGVKILLAKLVRRRGKLARRNPKREFGVPEQHQIKIAKSTLKLSDMGARIMGGMTKEEARAILKKYGIPFKENPVRQSVLIYDKLLGIEARKQHGKFKGENFRHDFKKDTDAVVMGNPDGSLTIRSKKGKRLWGKFDYD